MIYFSYYIIQCGKRNPPWGRGLVHAVVYASVPALPLASIEISSDKDFGRGILNAGAELVRVGQSGPDVFVDQLGNR